MNIYTLSDGITARSRKAILVPALAKNVISIAAGYWHACAVRQDKSVACWGRIGTFRREVVLPMLPSNSQSKSLFLDTYDDRPIDTYLCT